ncbi:DUF732 domain-containing protein [Pseudonocardia bannensis]|uniref:DUF732 domain-containing protein n=1 Tax=Pseudonocardia bannensis TaxID=630973 RepID=A0A848DQA5_9PSEU|nr:DUF732 domain-containing protein [Pseudonocardia bannensis]NMH94725.1 DUF732 domain-containing protein [Pseudonocardia bannensis]
MSRSTTSVVRGLLLGAVAGSLAAAGVALASGDPAGRDPVPAAVAVTAPQSAPQPAPAPDGAPPVDTGAPAAPDAPEDPAWDYLAALREAQIPTSHSGEAELTIAQVVCDRTASGWTEDELSRGIPRSQPTVTREQARTLVQIALRTYC